MVVTLLLLPAAVAAGPEWPVAVTVAAGARARSGRSGESGAGEHRCSVPRRAVGFENGDRWRGGTAGDASTTQLAGHRVLRVCRRRDAAAGATGRQSDLGRAAPRLALVRRFRDSEWKSLVDSCARGAGSVHTSPPPPCTSAGDADGVGLRRPAVLVSDDAETWSEDRRRAVMLHELAHVRRRDSLTQTLASLATALYWPHPGVWWAARRLQVEREFACDDCVLRAGARGRQLRERPARDRLYAWRPTLAGAGGDDGAARTARRTSARGAGRGEKSRHAGVGKPRGGQPRGAGRPRTRGSHRDHHASGGAARRGRRRTRRRR